MTLTDEQRRILKQRIAAAILDARYYPAKHQDEQAVAENVLRYPFTPQVHNVGKDTRERKEQEVRTQQEA